MQEKKENERRNWRQSAIFTIYWLEFCVPHAIEWLFIGLNETDGSGEFMLLTMREWNQCYV